MAALAASRLITARCRPDEAIAQLGQSIDAAESHSRFGSAIELRILRSLSLAKLGNIQEAQTELERALVLAEPEGYVRIFLDEGLPMQMLLSQWFSRCSGWSR